MGMISPRSDADFPLKLLRLELVWAIMRIFLPWAAVLSKRTLAKPNIKDLFRNNAQAWIDSSMDYFSIENCRKSMRLSIVRGGNSTKFSLLQFKRYWKTLTEKIWFRICCQKLCCSLADYESSYSAILKRFWLTNKSFLVAFQYTIYVGNMKRTTYFVAYKTYVVSFGIIVQN